MVAEPIEWQEKASNRLHTIPFFVFYSRIVKIVSLNRVRFYEGRLNVSLRTTSLHESYIKSLRNSNNLDNFLMTLLVQLTLARDQKRYETLLYAK